MIFLKYMNYKIRRGVFETNSSSSHAFCICTEDEYRKFNQGLMFFDHESSKMIDRHELYNRLNDRYNSNKRYTEKQRETLRNVLEVLQIEDDVEFREAFAKTYYDIGEFIWAEDSDHFYEERDEITKYYTSPSGDKLVLVGGIDYD